MSELIIRNETKQDYRIVETMTREAFWNQHVPGCDEHYIAHVMHLRTKRKNISPVRKSFTFTAILRSGDEST